MKKTLMLAACAALLCFAVLRTRAQDAASRPVIIAHRGASGYLPEHTLAATAMACAWDIDFIEPDLVLSKDGVPVVLHDIHLETTTNVAALYPERKRADGRYYAIDFTLAEIKRLRVNERRDALTGKAAFPKRYPLAPTPFTVPTLDEQIALVAGLNRSTGRSIGIYPEIKHPAFHKKEGKDITRIVLKALRAAGYESKDARIYLQCFDPAALERLSGELKTTIPLIQLIAANSWKESTVDYDAMRSPEGLAGVARYAQGVGVWIDHVLEQGPRGVQPTALVAAAHARGLKVHAYTLRADKLPRFAKSFEELGRMLFKDAGIDGIFTDHPDKTLKLLQRRASRF